MKKPTIPPLDLTEEARERLASYERWLISVDRELQIITNKSVSHTQFEPGATPFLQLLWEQGESPHDAAVELLTLNGLGEDDEKDL